MRQPHRHLFVNAGGGGMTPPGQIAEAHHADMFDRNIKGLLFTVKKALPLLAEGACVILPGSTTAVMGTPALSVYSASKAAVRALARSWILALENRPIRANVISRGPVCTPGPVELADDAPAARQGLLDHLASQVPPGRVFEPKEIAKMVLFLAPDDSSFVTTPSCSPMAAWCRCDREHGEQRLRRRPFARHLPPAAVDKLVAYPGAAQPSR